MGPLEKSEWGRDEINQKKKVLYIRRQKSRTFPFGSHTGHGLAACPTLGQHRQQPANHKSTRQHKKRMTIYTSYKIQQEKKYKSKDERSLPIKVDVHIILLAYDEEPVACRPSARKPTR